MLINKTITVSVNEVWNALEFSDKTELLERLIIGGYADYPEGVGVDDWYEGASEGEREHMANKLSKHGYPTSGIWSSDKVRAQGYDKGFDDGFKTGKDQPLQDVVSQSSLHDTLSVLKKFNITLERIVLAWGHV